MGDLVINSRQSLEEFLALRPTDWSTAIAVRAAQRSAVFLGDEESAPELILATFRAILVAERGSEVRSFAACRAFRPLEAPNRSAAAAERAAVRAAYTRHRAASFLANYSSAGDAVGNAAYASSDESYRIWEVVAHDCQLLVTGKTCDDLLAQPLWHGATPKVSLNAAEAFDQRLDQLGGSWGWLAVWYKQVTQNAALDPFGEGMLDKVANQPTEFWGDGRDENGELAYWGRAVDNARTPDDVMADIARITGWPDSVREKREAPVTATDDNEFDTSRMPDQDPSGPQLSETLPIAPDRDGGAPIEIRDRDYYHRSMAMQAAALLETCVRSGGSVYQSCSRIHMHTSMFVWALGEKPGGIYSPALQNEAAILQETLDLNEKLKDAEKSGDIVEGEILREDTASGARALLGTYEKYRENELDELAVGGANEAPPENADEIIKDSFGLPQIMREADGAFDPGLIDHYDAAQDDAAREQRLGRLGRGARYLQRAVTNLAIATVRAVAGALVTAGRLAWKGGQAVLVATAANTAAAVVSPGVIIAMQKIATASGNPYLIAYADFIARVAGLVV